MSSKTEQWHGGKGSYRRNENKEAYESNWDKIFGTKTTVIEAEDFGGIYSEEDVIFGNVGYSSMPDDAVQEEVAETEESEMDRYERHMEPIRKAQAKTEVPTAHFPPYND